jgi:hypothetical protein
MFKTQKETPSMKSRHSRNLLLATALLLVTATLLAAGCGGSDQTATTVAGGSSATAASSGESGSVVITGLVDNPMTLTAVDLDYMDLVTVTVDHPELGSTKCTGVRLDDIFSAAGVQSSATTLLIARSDGTSVKIPLADITSDDAMLAVADDGTLNAVMPGLDSADWVEDVITMQFN